MDTSSEIWKKVNEFYEISSIGRLRRIKPEANTWIGRILKPIKRRNYLAYAMTINGKTFLKSIHHLVLEAFIEKRPIGKCTNHKNGIKTDNRIENLEWVTPKENTFHSYYILGKGLGENSGMAKLTTEQVKEIKNNCHRPGYLKYFSKKFNVCKSTISHIKVGRIWKHVK